MSSETSSHILHGGRAEKLFILDEDPAEFAGLLAQLRYDFSFLPDQQPLEDMAHARWILWRRHRAFNAMEANLYEAQADITLWPPAAHHQLVLADSYKTTAERALRRATVNLDAAHQKHLRALQLQEDSRRWAAQDTLHQSRLEMQRERLALTKAREARLARKEELQATLAAERAQDALHKLDDDRWSKACNGLHHPAIQQDISVTHADGATETRCRPTNTRLLELLDRPTPYPIQTVARRFHFPNGIPAEYAWAIDADSPIDLRHTDCHYDEDISPWRFEVYTEIAEELDTHDEVGLLDYTDTTPEKLRVKMRRFFALPK